MHTGTLITVSNQITRAYSRIKDHDFNYFPFTLGTDHVGFIELHVLHAAPRALNIQSGMFQHCQENK